MKIYLVRHGETDWNTKLLYQGHTDIGLNSLGISQAKYIAKELKDKKIQAIISSDLRRAYKTAEIIKKTCKYKGIIIRDRRLRERSYGDLEGKLYNFFQRRRKNFTGEKDAVFFARVNACFKSIIRKYKGKNTAIITHGGVVRQIVSFVLGLKNYKKIRIYNASISEIFYNEEKKVFFLLLLNSVAHLPKKDRNRTQYHIKGV